MQNITFFPSLLYSSLSSSATVKFSFIFLSTLLDFYLYLFLILLYLYLFIGIIFGLCSACFPYSICFHLCHIYRLFYCDIVSRHFHWKMAFFCCHLFCYLCTNWLFLLSCLFALFFLAKSWLKIGIFLNIFLQFLFLLRWTCSDDRH